MELLEGWGNQQIGSDTKKKSLQIKLRLHKIRISNYKVLNMCLNNLSQNSKKIYLLKIIWANSIKKIISVNRLSL